MTTLTQQQRAEELALWQRELSQDRESVGIVSKAELALTLAAVDDAIEAHWLDLTRSVSAKVKSNLGDKLLSDLMAKAVKRRAKVAGRVG
jgi:hypothetical protein